MRKEKTDVPNINCSGSGNESNHILISNNDQLCQGVLMSTLSGGPSQHLSTPKPERPTSLSGVSNKITRRNISYRGDQCKYKISGMREVN